MYWQYFKYVVKHKWFVLQACFKHGLYWRGLVHDLSKFLPSEFAPYARYFYGDKLKDKPKEVKLAFQFAWHLHQKRNDHHYQWWLYTKENGTLAPFPMSDKAIKEMICDWIGMSKAFKTAGPVSWYKKNSKNLKLNKESRIKVVNYLKEWFPLDFDLDFYAKIRIKED